VTERLVIIGSGMAAARLLEILAERGSAFAITVIGAEMQPSYNRILLSSVLCGDNSEGDLPLLTESWYRQQGVALITGGPAVNVDPWGRWVTTRSGRCIPWDKLVFATGSRAHIPDIPGVCAEGVLGFRGLADLDTIRRRAGAGGPAVVVGGGLLGLEAAHGLNALGMEVTLVHRQPLLMNRQLDGEAAEQLRELLARRGIRFALGASPRAVTSDGQRATGVALDDGRCLAAELVLFAAGIDANTELAAAAGIPCDRAIVADPLLRTGVDGIFALGECCQIDGRTFGLVAPVWQQAEVLAAVLDNQPTPGYCHREVATQLKVSGVDLYAAGAMPFPEGAHSLVLRDRQRGIYRRLVISGNRLVGAILLGDRSAGNWYGELIDSGADISGIRSRIMFGPEFCRAG